MSLRWTWLVPFIRDKRARADLAITNALKENFGQWDTITPHPSDCQKPVMTRNQIQRLIQENKIRVNSMPIQSNTRLKQNDKIEIEFTLPTSINLNPENIPLHILYEDSDLLIVNKPQGLSVHPSMTEKNGTLVNALLYHVKDLSGIGGKLRPGIVHRLDKFTSGALVITKTDAAHICLSKIFSSHQIERRYQALCYGSHISPCGKSLEIESLIGRNRQDRKKMTTQVKQGKKAKTIATVLEKFAQVRSKKNTSAKPFASLVELKLETGRTHQVRVHLTHLGNSILGDPLYGVPTERHLKWLSLPDKIRNLVQNLPGQALHAQVLGFKHPTTNKVIRIEAVPPSAFSNLLEELRKYPF
jgi:23S rRNA pseudouridine1911/1915/1917 synthase